MDAATGYEKVETSGELLRAIYDAIIVPLDGSKVAAQALPIALAIAIEHGARLILFRALVPTNEPAESISATQTGKRDGSNREYDLRRSQAEGYLEGIKRSLEGSGVTVEMRIEDGAAATGVLAAARCADRPLIVLTAHGLNARRSAEAYGSVASEVVQQREVPVLTIDPR